MNWISPAELALIHEWVIAETGGVHGITNPGGLESALARPFTTFGGVELFPDLSDDVPPGTLNNIWKQAKLGGRL